MSSIRILYIGQFSEGTTSKMRAEALAQITSPNDFQVIDTHVPFFGCHPIWRSIAFRFKTGKIIHLTNRYIINNISGNYDTIWVDKAIFLTKKTTKQLKNITKQLIHYTPDTAFKENLSLHFNKSLSFYDYVITTKSFEKEDYLKHIEPQKLISVPQGYNKDLHYPRHSFEEKKKHVLFIGLNEPSREKIVDTLLNCNIPVVLAGMNWKNFASKRKNSCLTYLGNGLFGEEYAKTISQAAFGLGLVSKRFPELHTTRTFEIPACRTALVTERNKETTSLFNEDEVIFFSNTQEILERIRFYLERPDELKQITVKGYQKVVGGGYDYREQLKSICKITGTIDK